MGRCGRFIRSVVTNLSLYGGLVKNRVYESLDLLTISFSHVYFSIFSSVISAFCPIALLTFYTLNI